LERSNSHGIYLKSYIGNAALQRLLAQHACEAPFYLKDPIPTRIQRTVVQRNGGIVSMPPQAISADPTEARRTFARIRESVQAYSDNALDYFSNQYFSAMTSFKLWYDGQERADASFFNAVINIIMNSAWAWGTPAVGAVVAPVGSIVMLVAQEAARAIQTSRDDFASSLIRSANNLQSGVQRRLRGQIPNILGQRDPTLWDDIQQNAYLGEEWQPLLHDRGKLPRPGEEIHQRLLAELILNYRQWELSQHTALYQGIYSMVDPYQRHMRSRAEAEAYVERGEPIPRRIRKYARPGEAVAPE